MKVNPNITSDCGNYSGYQALDGDGRPIVMVSRALDGHRPLELFFDGKIYDYGYGDDLLGADTYIDHSDLGVCHDV